MKWKIEKKIIKQLRLLCYNVETYATKLNNGQIVLGFYCGENFIIKKGEEKKHLLIRAYLKDGWSATYGE